VAARRARLTTQPSSTGSSTAKLMIVGIVRVAARAADHVGGRRTETENPDPIHLPRLLRLGGERRGKEATTEGREERSAVQQ
jgi:hypothetical protein